MTYSILFNNNINIQEYKLIPDIKFTEEKETEERISTVIPNGSEMRTEPVVKNLSVVTDSKMSFSEQIIQT